MFTADLPRPAALSSVVLSLSINRTPYEVHPLSGDREVAVKGYELRKGNGTSYHVAQFRHGCECTCPDFIFRRDGIDPSGCKHIKALGACLMLETGVRS